MVKKSIISNREPMMSSMQRIRNTRNKEMQKQEYYEHEYENDNDNTIKNINEERENLRKQAAEQYSSSSDSFRCQRINEPDKDGPSPEYDEESLKHSTSRKITPEEFDYLNNSNGSIVWKEEAKKPTISSSRYGEASERSVGQIPLQQSRTHHRNIAIKTGRKAEHNESDDHDHPMKTVYPDPSRNGITKGSVSKRDSNSILETFPVEVLKEALSTLQSNMENDIMKIRRKYTKLMDPIQNAINNKVNK